MRHRSPRSHIHCGRTTAGLTFRRGGADAAVRALRKAKGQSHEVLATEIGTSVVTLSKMERGENAPTLGVLLSPIAAFISKPPSWPTLKPRCAAFAVIGTKSKAKLLS
jgi:DNA-binding XRE family transcriptional regulator